MLELRRYHIPLASVSLLSSQSVYKTLGSNGSQTVEKYSMHLPGSVILDAPLWQSQFIFAIID